MLEGTRAWLRRNRTRFAVGFGVLGVGYLAGQYVLGKIVETRERMANDRRAREDLRRRFVQNQEDCSLTVLALLPTATENILDAIPVESITHELQQQKAERLGRSVGASELAPSEISSAAPSLLAGDSRDGATSQAESFMHTSQMAQSSLGTGEESTQQSQKPRKTKPQLWNELKINSITRSFTLIYTLSLLTLLTRIQLNLLGRLNYLSSVVSLASPSQSTISLENRDDDRGEQTYGNDFETNRKYLTFSWWLLHRGWRDIMEKVSTAVQEIFGPISVREDVTLEKLSALVVEVRKRVEGQTQEDRRKFKWLPFLLPPRDQETHVLQESGMLGTPPTTAPSSSSTDAPLRHLLDETSDLIDSPTATHIHTLLLDTLFSQLTDTFIRQQAYKLSSSPLSSQPTSLPSSSTTSSPPPPSRVTELYDDGSDPTILTAKLATILAVITRQAHIIGNGVLPNIYVQAMEEVKELEAFAAVVYSSHFELQGMAGRDVGLGSGATAAGEGSGRTLAEALEKEALEAEEAVGGAGEELPEAGRSWGIWESVWGRTGGEAAKSI